MQGRQGPPALQMRYGQLGTPRETAGVQLEFLPMPYLAPDGVLCTFSTRTSATAAGFARN
jgi:hypothetical protein